MPSIEHRKWLTKAFEYRDRFWGIKAIEVQKGIIDAFDGATISLEKNIDSSHFSFHYAGYWEQGDFKEIGPINGFAVETEMTIPNLSIRGYSLTLGTKGGGHNFSGIIERIHTSSFDFNTPKRFRSILTSKKDVRFSSVIDRISYKYDEDGFNSEGIELFIDDNIFHVCIAKTDDGIYNVIIDCITPILHQTFSSFSYGIMMAWGFISGHFIQSEEVCLMYDDEEMNEPKGFYFTSLRESLRHIYPPFSFHFPDELHHDVHKKMSTTINMRRTMDMPSFSKLAKLCASDKMIQAIMILTFESMSSSLVTRPCGLSVVLEALATYFSKLFPKETTVFAKKLSDNIKAELNKVLDEYAKNPILESGIQKYRNDVQRINSLANKDLLQFPFKKLNITLTSDEIKLLEKRNNFLHGRIDDISIKTSYDSYSMLFLINIAILKLVGYSGLVFNQSAIQRMYQEKYVSDNLYRIL